MYLHPRRVVKSLPSSPLLRSRSGTFGGGGGGGVPRRTSHDPLASKHGDVRLAREVSTKYCRGPASLFRLSSGYFTRRNSFHDVWYSIMLRETLLTNV